MKTKQTKKKLTNNSDLRTSEKSVETKKKSSVLIFRSWLRAFPLVNIDPLEVTLNTKKEGETTSSETKKNVEEKKALEQKEYLKSNDYLIIFQMKM